MDGHERRLEAARVVPGFGLRESVAGGVVVLQVCGELDAETTPVLRERLESVLSGGCVALVVDLGDVTYVDSLALAALVAARRRLIGRGRLAVVADGPFVLLILQASGLDGVLDLFPDVETARAFVAKEPDDES